MKLNLNEIKPLMSGYIQSGYKKDNVVISSLKVSKNSRLFASLRGMFKK
jgi:hypothetical protein